MENKNEFDKIKSTSIETDADKSFNRLQKLQTLLKKEYGLRELCKK